MILPSLAVSDCGSAVLIARQIAAMLKTEGIDTGICADRKSKFSGIAFFEAPSPASLRLGRTGTTAEEYLRGYTDSMGRGDFFYFHILEQKQKRHRYHLKHGFNLGAFIHARAVQRRLRAGIEIFVVCFDGRI